LVVSRLAGCALDTAINLPSLSEFSLKEVYFDYRSIIDNLIFTCTFIDKFSLIACFIDTDEGLNFED
jgi:hypothetical protein